MGRMFFEFLITLTVLGAGAYTIITIARLIFPSRGESRGLASAALEDRVVRLEGAVEALTAENQRLVEGHRFFTQLLVNRPAPAAQELGRLAAGTNNRRDERTSG
jgi:hypothetical protein